jgi:hypothetical protein
MLLTVAAAWLGFLAGQLFRKTAHWVPAAFAAGALLAFTAQIGQGVIDYIPIATAAQRASELMAYEGCFAALSAWASRAAIAYWR